MKPDGELSKDRELSEEQTQRSFKWKVLRATICELYFKGRSENHCPDCEDRILCFQMIKETLDLSTHLRAENQKNERQERRLLTHQGCT